MDTEKYWDNIFKEGKDFTTLNEILLDTLLLPKLEKRSGSHLKLLDVGCGTGDTLKKFKDRGFDVFGVDVSSEAVGLAKKRIGVNDDSIVVGDIETDPVLSEKEFDLAIVKLVIAFIEDKARFLETLKSLLSVSGKILIITPLLYREVTYHKKHTIGISIFEDEFVKLLHDHFTSTELLHKDFHNDNSVVGYYLCSNV